MGLFLESSNGTERGFLLLEKVVLLAQHELWVLLPGGALGPPGGANLGQILLVFEFFSWSSAGVVTAASSAANNSNSGKLDLLAVALLILLVNFIGLK